MLKFLATTVFVAALAAAPSAFARSIFLNGVDISTLRGKTFKNATIYIDASGNIHIDAPKYKVKVVDDPVPAQPARRPHANGGPNPSLNNHYYLVTNPSPAGRAQYDFIVLINGIERKVIKAGSGQTIIEISAWLNRGTNQIAVTAKKRLGNGRKSFSSADRAKLVIGRGHEAGKRVKISAVLMSLSVDASQVDDTTKHQTLEAH